MWRGEPAATKSNTNTLDGRQFILRLNPWWAFLSLAFWDFFSDPFSVLWMYRLACIQHGCSCCCTMSLRQIAVFFQGLLRFSSSRWTSAGAALSFHRYFELFPVLVIISLSDLCPGFNKLFQGTSCVDALALCRLSLPKLARHAGLLTGLPWIFLSYSKRVFLCTVSLYLWAFIFIFLFFFFSYFSMAPEHSL